jgi:hypothetical protein
MSEDASLKFGMTPKRASNATNDVVSKPVLSTALSFSLLLHHDS